MPFPAIVLRPLLFVYECAARARNYCYDAGMLRAERVSVPVVSVGNVSPGGTGKTPCVELVVGLLSRRGMKVAVVSRGYGRSTGGTVVVSDGKSVLAGPAEGGDEPYQIARKFPGAVVLVDERRARGARAATEEFGADVIVLDDGFQHRSLHRDLDIVMIGGTSDPGRRPRSAAGFLREPWSGLKRAGLVIVNGGDRAPEYASWLRKWSDAPVLRGSKVARGVRSVAEGAPVKERFWKGKPVTAFCGIADPDSFRGTLAALGVEADRFVRFPDHHSYTAADIGALKNSRDVGAGRVYMTTEKDAVKIAPLGMSSDMLYVEIGLACEPESVVTELLDRLVSAPRT